MATGALCCVSQQRRLARRRILSVCAPMAAYLITGGLGDIALRLARAMVKRRRETADPDGDGRRCRHAKPGVRSTQAPLLGSGLPLFVRWRPEGVAVHVACVDVGDESALRTFLDRYRAEAWPPICGVIHAVGALDDCLAVSMSRARFDALLDPKLRGAQYLDRLLPELDFFALMSSTAALLAQTGQANYAAANAGLDALAQDRRSRGAAAISVAWGVWEDTGLMKGSDAALKFAEIDRQGMNAIPPARGAGLFPVLCQSGESYLAVLPIDRIKFRQARLARSYPIFADIARRNGGNSGPRRR